MLFQALVSKPPETGESAGHYVLKQVYPPAAELADQQARRQALYEKWQTEFARPGLVVEIHPLPLGSETAAIVVYRREGESGRETGVLMLNVHENEKTSVKAGLDVLEMRGGVLLQLRHSGTEEGERNLPIAGDPNRIFFDLSVRAKKLAEDPPKSPAAPAGSDAPRVPLAPQPQGFAEWLRPEWDLTFGVRQAILDEIGAYAPKAILALHNTYGTSVRSFKEDEIAHHEAWPGRVDFFLTTQRRTYEYLKAQKQNVVLQDNPKVAQNDDGSLSVLFGRTTINYVNVEAAHAGSEQDERAGGNARERQARMVELVYARMQAEMAQDQKPRRVPRPEKNLRTR